MDKRVPYYNEKGLVEDDRHCVISPFGMLSREEKNYKQFRTDSLDRVRIPDERGHHNVTSFRVPIEKILDIENGYIHRIREDCERFEPGRFQLTGRGDCLSSRMETCVADIM